MLLLIRNALFALGYLIGTIILGILTMAIFQFMPYRKREYWLLHWNRWVLWWAKVCCGVRWQIINPENIPNQACVYLSNHESQGETYYLQLKLRPVSTVLKQELLDIPFFGWGLRLVEPIAIDRGSPKLAMKKMLADGAQRLASGLNVLVYPQGTRQVFKAPLKYTRGGAAIAVEAQTFVVPIAHNAAQHWPSNGFRLKPGTISVIIGTPIDTRTSDAKQATELARAWAEQQLQQLNC